MNKILSCGICLILSCLGFSQTLRVLAAASLKESLTQCAHKFEAQHPGAAIQMSFGGSDTFATQILLGASVDLFLSADRAQMLRVVKANKADSHQVHPLLTNELVIIVPSNGGNLVHSLRDLSLPKIRIALAKKTVPAGAYARSALMRASKLYGTSFYNKVLNNVVTNDLDVRDVLAHVALNEVDAGFVYVTDAGVAGSKVKIIELPAQLKTIAAYSIAVLRNAQHRKLSDEFMKFLLGKQGQTIFKNWGFGPRNQATS